MSPCNAELPFSVDLAFSVWPEVPIFVRGDTGFAVPAMYEYCEREGLFYCFGYATNPVLVRRTESILAAGVVQFQQTGEAVQSFTEIEDYQAGTWTRAASWRKSK